METRTQVGIIGAGPAGLVLAHLLRQRGIDCVVLERQSRSYVEARIRAGVLEHGTVDLLTSLGLADRLHRQRMVHHGIELLFAGEAHRIPLTELAGREITIYGQHEVVKDLIAAWDGPLHFSVSDVQLADLTGEPIISYVDVDGVARRLRCDVVAGCDGFHGVSRAAIPAGVLTAHERDYPHAWLGILADAPPSSEELIYAHSSRGFALHSMRSPTVTRMYLQVRPDENLDEWPDDRIWAELRARLARSDAGWQLADGPILERSVAAMRSFVVSPMQHGQLFLAGDAAHIVPPTGAKGLNLAVADVKVLADALTGWYATGDRSGLDAYSETCLRRVWRVQHFSWWMTSMLHPTGDDPFDLALQLSQLRYVTSSRAAATSLAENYVGFPFP
ncbi:4-hydroxybenzoate 3-monooxygenase [Asanoa sp. WMMD1127]|uniref:4-hydroxybenzoate 3-monooxygenase n=1 Tax=Asanoa sp. WMMD1127 TaxID=3016107 RepID=UPI002416936D|nr:4-hydroxybenzoate 3-monooxygenase [Asanoa sp. WMMD1127]MDG4823164.1 4-hydroxybenzoate 3-monooxygenase [Asanoa sp. WMMD1127]